VAEVDYFFFVHTLDTSPAAIYCPLPNLTKNPFLPVTVVVLGMQLIKRESDKLTRIMQNGQLHHHPGSHRRSSRPEGQPSRPMETMRMDMHGRGHLKVALAAAVNPDPL